MKAASAKHFRRTLPLLGIIVVSSALALAGSTKEGLAGHSSSALLSFITPVGAGSNGQSHASAHLTTPWHASGPWALDFDEHLSDGSHGGSGSFGAHVHVFAYHPGGTGTAANATSYYQGPTSSPSGCHEVRVDIKNRVTGKLEAEYTLIHVTGGSASWVIWGGDPMRFNDLNVGATASWESCPWTDDHIHETHRVRGSDHGHSHSFSINSARWDCTCDAHGTYNNGADWTRSVRW